MDGERGYRGRAGLISNAQPHEAGREGIKQHDHVIAETDVLRPLSNIETDLGGALSTLMAIDLEDPVFESKTREAFRERVFIIERDVRPSFPGFRRRERCGRFGTTVGPYVNRTAVWALHAEMGSDSSSIDDLNQKSSSAKFEGLRLDRSRPHFDAAFRVDFHDGKRLLVQNALELRDDGRFIQAADGLVDLILIFQRKGLSEVA